MTALERAIAAINNTSRVQEIAGDQCGVLGAVPLHVVTNPKEIARAVLQAIREPSPRMLQAGIDELDHGIGIVAAWPAMVDAALEEG